MASRQLLILNKQLKKALALPVNQRWTQCRRFIEAGADPNMFFDSTYFLNDGTKMPILHKAIFDNNYDAVKVLLERGADKRLKNQEFGFGATEFAAYLGLDPIKLL